MLSLIEVKCPHCGAQGQIMLPPLGAIIVGPCPECQGMVVVFCGRVFPLEKEIMTSGSAEEKREHLLEVLGLFLHDRISRLFSEEAAGEAGATEDTAEDTEDDSSPLPGKITVPGQTANDPLIGQDELETFVNVDLKLLDNKDYFKAVFE